MLENTYMTIARSAIKYVYHQQYEFDVEFIGMICNYYLHMPQ